MKTNEPKIFFIDLDGTLMDEKSFPSSTTELYQRISALNKAAIMKVQNATPIIISTGRPASLVLPLIQKLNIPYAITQNGALIIDQKGNHISVENMDKKTGLKVMDFVIKHKLAIKFNDDRKIYGCHFIAKILTKKFKLIPIKKYNQLINRIHLENEVTKFVLAGKLKHKIQKYTDMLNNSQLPIIAVTSSKGYTIEITSINATKGKADLFVAQKMGFKAEQAAHLGDTMNDSTTAGLLGWLIAMDNASKPLKKLATHLGPDYKNGGVAKILLNKDYVEKK